MKRMTFRTALVACARWESPYIVEWIEYHIDLGFDHIYLYCNDDDPFEFKSVVKTIDVAYRDKVSIRTYKGQGLQRAMYLDALPCVRQESEWLCFLDIDEFLVLKAWGSIGMLIDDLDARAISSLHFNWIFYGNNGYVQRPPGAVLQNYTRRSRSVDPHTKHISRTSCFERDRVNNAQFPIWHGLADPYWVGFDRRNVLGHDMGRLLAEFPLTMSAYLADEARCQDIIVTAYVAHFVFKSADDFKRRVARGLNGDFGGQIKWQQAIDSGATQQILETMNEVDDSFLAMRRSA